MGWTTCWKCKERFGLDDATEAEACKMSRVLLAYSVDPAHPTLPEQLREAGITIGEEG